jgi:signal transduction histidine kinase
VIYIIIGERWFSAVQLRCIAKTSVRYMMKLFHFLYKKLIYPKSKDKDRSRREFILNILLVGNIALSVLALFSTLVNYLSSPSHYTGVNALVPFFALAFFITLLVLSRRRKIKVSALAFIVALLSLGFYASYRSGVDLPEGLLVYAVLITIAGIVISANFSFFLALIIGILLVLGGYLQHQGVFMPDASWKGEDLKMTDIVVNVVTLVLIALVSWLSSREIEKALKRARVSEAALRRQNNDLEEIVQERTKKMQQLELDKLMQMYRFAEFGKMASGLFHDLVNHLSLVSLNLDKLSEESKKLNQQEVKILLDRTMIGTKRLENFILGARKQMQNQEILQMFSVKDEINQILQLLSYKLKKAHVHVSFSSTKDEEVFGSPIKFGQILTNLVINAIDAYDEVDKEDKRIKVLLKIRKENILVIVKDWGSGIDKEHISKIFDPLFTTKSFEKGMGLGLAVCKDIIEKDFKGEIYAESHAEKGTSFSLLFPIQKAPVGKIKPQKSQKSTLD